MRRDEDISLEGIKRFLNQPEVSVDVDGPLERMETPFELSPRELLEFAEVDLANSYDHHLLNALSNAKRAISCQVDNLLCLMLLLEVSQKENWRFPRKIEILNQLGIISPQILLKVNRKRNMLEHEYRQPSAEEVEDAVGVAQLFINYTDKYLVDGMGRTAIYADSLDYEITFWLDRVNKGIVVEARYPEGEPHKRSVSHGSDEYLEVLAVVVGLNTQIHGG